MSMNKYKKLFNNSIIFAIGNLGSKLMQFIMVPLYSFTLTTSEFGKTDIITTIISLLSPLVSLEIYDAVFRFAMDKSENKKVVLNSGLVITLLSSIVILLLGFVLNLFSFFKGYCLVLDCFLLVCTIFYSLISNYVRAIGYSKPFAIAGVINTFIMAGMNVVLLYFWKMGVAGYVISMIVGLLIGSLYLLTTGIRKDINLRYFNRSVTVRMFIYSLPLIPNSLSWWINSTSDRLFILAMVGVSANGLYAMANKIPNAVTILTNIFYQSWQISAVEEYDNKNAREFITNVFNVFTYILLIGSILILMFIRPFFKILIDPSYYSAWRITPLVLWSLIYSSISGFLGTIYTATKKTGEIFITTVYGAIVNIVASLVFIKLFGIYGAALANAISFLVVLAVRYYHLYVNGRISFNIKNIIFLHLVFFGYSAIVLVTSSNILTIIFGIVVIALIAMSEWNKIKSIFHIDIKIK